MTTIKQAVPTFDFNAWQRRFPSVTRGGMEFRQLPRIMCADGFNISVQASESHYCSPRATGEPFYSHVECGYPSAREDALMPFAESPELQTETVYGWVPVEIVEAIIHAHGGTDAADDPSTEN